MLQGSEVLPRHWVVERVFGWMMECRRPVQDGERTIRCATGWIDMALTPLMQRRPACFRTRPGFSDGQ